MSRALYLAVMLGIVVLVAAVCIPALFLKKCPACGRRCGLEAARCKACGYEFPQSPGG